MNSLPVVTLNRRGSRLSDPACQRQILENPELELPRFEDALGPNSPGKLTARRIGILQVNVGKLCNMTCRHCHVDAGPDRKSENMDWATMEACLRAIEQVRIPTLDLTGGAPEMNPNFRRFVSAARALGCHVIDRCNLTILLARGFTDLPDFLAEHCVEIVASLPCYLQENADSQRGDGAFDKSIEALRLLNERGYGSGNPERKLTLVYNPVGMSLPPEQAGLEAAYREQLSTRYGIQFDRLFTITNMPISRFLDELLASGEFETYLAKLVAAYNPVAAEGVMCRDLVSVGWDGQLYDCDFNQMLDLPVRAGYPRHIRDFDEMGLSERVIATGRHCFGCTAGSGSGCSGAIDL